MKVRPLAVSTGPSAGPNSLPCGTSSGRSTAGESLDGQSLGQIALGAPPVLLLAAVTSSAVMKG